MTDPSSFKCFFFYSFKLLALRALVFHAPRALRVFVPQVPCTLRTLVFRVPCDGRTLVARMSSVLCTPCANLTFCVIPIPQMPFFLYE